VGQEYKTKPFEKMIEEIQAVIQNNSDRKSPIKKVN